MVNMSGRAWTDGELIVSVYLYRFGYEDLGLSYEQIADIFGRSPDTFFYRFANFLSMETGRGLRNTGNRAREIFESYRGARKDDLRKMSIKMILDHVRSGNTNQ